MTIPLTWHNPVAARAVIRRILKMSKAQYEKAVLRHARSGAEKFAPSATAKERERIAFLFECGYFKGATD